MKTTRFAITASIFALAAAGCASTDHWDPDLEGGKQTPQAEQKQSENQDQMAGQQDQTSDSSQGTTDDQMASEESSQPSDEIAGQDQASEQDDQQAGSLGASSSGVSR